MNCIWITTDSFRQDHIHCYRPEGTVDDTGPTLRVQTPGLDRLARQAVRFTRMRSEALPTIPCRRGCFTGRRVFPWKKEPFPKGLRVKYPGWRPLRQNDVTLAEHLGEQGYRTMLIADTYHLFKPTMNFHRGFDGFRWERGQEFDHWRTRPLPDGVLRRHMKRGVDVPEGRQQVLRQYLQNLLGATEEDLPVAKTFRAAIDWLRENRHHDNFFLYVDTFSPHEPWMVPERLLKMYDSETPHMQLMYGNPYTRDQLTDEEHRHLRARYAASCTMVDDWIGKLLDEVDRQGLARDTLIVLMSDHGKIIGEFGHYGMPPECTGLALNPVPCIIRHPAGERAGSVFDGWLYNIDLTATVLGLLGVAPKSDVEGENVWPAVCSGAEGFRPHLVTAYGDWQAAWRDDWLYLREAGKRSAALYNLADDPQRYRNVTRKYPSERKELVAALAEVTG